MSPVLVSTYSAVTAAGVGEQALAGWLADRDGANADPGVPVGGLYDDVLPAPTGHALVDFDVRTHIGRKGTSTLDRATALSVVCCQDVLRRAGISIDETNRARVGVALGTSLGSFKSTSDYTRDTLVQERPYLVNPMLFPNTVMNCAAGQVAIKFGLMGVNATVAGGPLAFLNALRYANNVLDRGYNDVMLAGAVEEFTPHRAWASHLTGATGEVTSGEAAALFVLTTEQPPAWARLAPRARILAVATAYGPGGDGGAEQALIGCIDRVLRHAGRVGADVDLVVTGESTDEDRREYGPATRALGVEPRRLLPKRMLGECDAASGAVALAVVLAGGHRSLALLTGRGAGGAVGAALVERMSDDGPDRG
ncbi:beta-ketoacyl synthase N-terminal-like domain-containing protein [Salinispora arenicola]|uniref:3-oxoacyl-[acyl-carrier-protein] synthase II n=1 Tax=Salinispora arenicola TaxID=168697 RepID=A0A542XT88_SALAC|nr:beta-ketoacyl synthase N-terminal-like domain-containing protein [Salinispora arenicola]TQL39061.1 3-oxoacyl-[acyl-carrier-protein] synthase II [Salinispora arenicola]GIM86880.1 hypothetical protein Sar04_36160 [Salinispora arenicola]